MINYNWALPREEKDNTPIREMNMAQLRPMLCAKCRGNVDICCACQSPCRAGLRAIEIRQKSALQITRQNAPEKPSESKADKISIQTIKQALERKKAANKPPIRTRHTIAIDYAEMIASLDDPIAYFIETEGLTKKQAIRKLSNLRHRRAECFGLDIYRQMTDEERRTLFERCMATPDPALTYMQERGIKRYAAIQTLKRWWGIYGTPKNLHPDAIKSMEPRKRGSAVDTSNPESVVQARISNIDKQIRIEENIVKRAQERIGKWQSQREALLQEINTMQKK